MVLRLRVVVDVVVDIGEVIVGSGTRFRSRRGHERFDVGNHRFVFFLFFLLFDAVDTWWCGRCWF